MCVQKFESVGIRRECGRMGEWKHEIRDKHRECENWNPSFSTSPLSAEH